MIISSTYSGLTIEKCCIITMLWFTLIVNYHASRSVIIEALIFNAACKLFLYK